jgi:hypothetical protein
MGYKARIDSAPVMPGLKFPANLRNEFFRSLLSPLEGYAGHRFVAGLDLLRLATGSMLGRLRIG